MPHIIDPETIDAEDLPGIWAPVQCELSEEERITELHEQARASLLYNVATPEAILRLLLSETEIDRALEPPDGYDYDVQGAWDESIVTFAFTRPVKLLKLERGPDRLYAEYRVADASVWAIEIAAERVEIYRL